MKRLTSLLEDLNAHANQRVAGQPGRPTSLYEAGGTGSQRQSPPAPARTDAIETGQEPSAEERGRRQPAQHPTLSRSSLQPTPAQRIRATLHDPASFRTAVLMREILDPPVSRRSRRTGR